MWGGKCKGLTIYVFICEQYHVRDIQSGQAWFYHWPLKCRRTHFVLPVAETGETHEQSHRGDDAIRGKSEEDVREGSRRADGVQEAGQPEFESFLRRGGWDWRWERFGGCLLVFISVTVLLGAHLLFLCLCGDDGVPRPSRSMSLTLGKVNAWYLWSWNILFEISRFAKFVKRFVRQDWVGAILSSPSARLNRCITYLLNSFPSVQALPRRRVSVAVVPKFNLLNIPGQTPATSPVSGSSPGPTPGAALPVVVGL